MRRVVIVVLGVVMLASPALAQENLPEKRAFVFIAPGVYTERGDSSILHFGGGIEAVAKSGFGFAFDAGYLRETTRFKSAAGSISVAMMYELRLERRARPYLRGGVGVIVGRYGGAFFWQVGGGVNYWFSDRAGIKVEVRDRISGSNLPWRLFEAAVGLVFKF